MANSICYPFPASFDEQGRYAIATHTISTVPSGTVLAILRGRADDGIGSQPYLGVAAWTQTGERPGFFREILSGPSRAQLVALPESKAEVESIGTILPKPSTLLLGESATKERFESLPLDRYEVLHLALHGYVDSQFPDRSALVFAPRSTAASGDSGFLQVREILKLHLNARLVTLSACDTGVGPVGDEGIDNGSRSIHSGGCTYSRVHALGIRRPVHRASYEDFLRPSGAWRVKGRRTSGSSDGTCP